MDEGSLVPGEETIQVEEIHKAWDSRKAGSLEGLADQSAGWEALGIGMEENSVAD